jgi:hypothetical protein
MHRCRDGTNTTTEKTPMIRRLLVPLLGSGLLLAATAGSALAKCEGPNPPEFCKSLAVDLQIGGGEGTLQAGTRETVTINLSLGEQPYDATSVVLTLARVADGDAVVVPAAESVRPGLWTADVLLPDGGSWTVVAQVITPDGTETMAPLQTIQVRKPPALPPATTPVTPPAAPPTAPILPVALGLLGVTAAALAGLGMRERSRRRAAVGAAASVASPATDRA